MSQSRETAPLTWAAVWALSAAALLVAAGETVFAARYGSDPRAVYVSDGLFAVAWTVAGLTAWRARPVSRVGLLMVAVGVALFLNNPGSFGLPTDFPLRGVMTVLALVGFWTKVALIGHLLLSYPTGRLEWRRDRLLVGASYVLAVVLPVAQLLVMTPDIAVCGDHCPVSPIRIVEDQGLYLGLRTLTSWCFAVLAMCLLLSLIVRVAKGGRRHWRAHAFALGAAVACAVLFTTFLVLTAMTRAPGGFTWLLYPVAYLCLLGVPGAFLVGLLRERLAYSAVADLLRGLAEMQPTDLQHTLAQALKDPNLVILFPLDDARGFVDLEGRSVVIPEGRSVTVLGDPAAPVAALLHDPALEEHPGLLEAIGAAARFALENARLQAQVRAQLAEARASRSRLVAAGDRERRRLERDLHDGAQQRLLGLGLTLQLLRSRVTEPDERLLDQAEHELRVAIRELRDLAQGIHPAVLADEGLLAGIGVLARRCPVPVSVEGDVEGRPSPAAAATAYYVASEALQNVVKHASASRVRIRVATGDGDLTVAISDDGVGGATFDNGSGLSGLVDRVVAAEGSLEVVSPAGGGTTVLARLPCG